MALSAGTRLGPYEILAAIGAGGMGEVYRARDTKLNRDVAIKVLPYAFAADADRLARFGREAQLLASLNHPNIAHVHGLEESGNTRALVMELVEGDDLSQRLDRGPLPLSEALPVAQADCRCARSRPRCRDHPSRSEAGEHQGSKRRDGQGPGFRAGEGARSGIVLGVEHRQFTDAVRPRHPSGHHPRHRGLHGA